MFLIYPFSLDFIYIYKSYAEEGKGKKGRVRERGKGRCKGELINN